MEESLIKVLEQDGINAVGLLAFVWFALQAQKTHREERSEWRESQNKINDKMGDLLQNNIESTNNFSNMVRENTEVIREMLKIK